MLHNPLFFYAASAHSGKSVDKFNFDIREGVYVLNRKIGKAFVSVKCTVYEKNQDRVAVLV